MAWNKRRPAQVALGVQDPDEAVEREVLMLERPEGGLPRPCQELAEGRLARQVASEDEHVDEVADQPLDLGAVPVGDRRADRDVVPRRSGGGGPPGTPPAAS